MHYQDEIQVLILPLITNYTSFDFLSILVVENKELPHLQILQRELGQHKTDHLNFTKINEILYYKRKVCFGKNIKSKTSYRSTRIHQ